MDGPTRFMRTLTGHDDAPDSPPAVQSSTSEPSTVEETSFNSTASSPVSTSTSPEIREEYEVERARFLCDLRNYIPLGVIRVHTGRNSDGKKVRLMVDHTNKPAEYPNKSILVMVEKEWLQLVRINNISDPSWMAIRVYVLPEDVGGHYKRGQINDYRRHLKQLISYVDTSVKGWNAESGQDSTTACSRCLGSLGQEESLFYIFNTLDSPRPSPANVLEPYSQKAMVGSLNGHIPGVRQELYPYQRRSVAAMIQKETAPVRLTDPRMRLHRGPCGDQFYYDHSDGRLLLQPNLYEDQRGGILAETMGYGKTLICVALILATRGHFPQIPEGRLAVEQSTRSRTGSLLEMAAAAAGRSGRPWKAHLHGLRLRGYHYESCTEVLHQSVCKYAEPLYVTRSGNRKKERPKEKMIKICSTTLIIVPPNLLGQWRGEIAKHTEVDALDVLTIDHSTKDIPNEDLLRGYDVVLITRTRFDQEYRDNDLHTGKRGKGEEVFRSPLSELRWLRVIVDEGHNFASSGQKTNAMAMLDNMHIERRWVVSGTPSNALIGVEVGMAADEIEDITESPSRRSKRVLQSRQAVDSYAEERKNLEKLRLIVMNFLKLRPWANSRGEDHAAWNRYMGVTRSTGSFQTLADLRGILQNLIIRHRIEDIEADLTLPPLFNKVQYLEPSYFDKLSINLFLAVLATNAVTSERTDQDYMFHAKNRAVLETLINNLRQSSFHWVGLKEHGLSEPIRISRDYLEKNSDRTSAGDKTLLLDAIDVGERALSSSAWKAFSTLHEIGVLVTGFPQFCSETWSLDGRLAEPLLLGTVQARAAQQYVDERLAEDDPTTGLSGAGIRAMSSARRQAAEEDVTAAKNKKDDALIEEPKLKDHTSTVRLRADGLTSTAKPASNTLDSSSPLASTTIVGFTSSKLSYLVSRVLELSSSEKIIVFYPNNNVAFWIAEALELVSIKFLIYSNTLTVARRATYLATFNQKADFRVLLMDIKQAAHGLHVAAASRVFIIEPVWQPGVESQAIKRAHRIGQTRPVYVETLVLRNTFEDRMLRRRKQMSTSELKKAEKSLLDDYTMGEIIKKERLIPFAPEETTAANQMASLLVPQQFFGRARGFDHGETEDDLVFDPSDRMRKVKRKRAVEVSGGVESRGTKKRKHSIKLARNHDIMTSEQITARPHESVPRLPNPLVSLFGDGSNVLGVVQRNSNNMEL